MQAVESFYTRYYNDSKKRTLILGINPGRLGAGATGIPFTDTKRLRDVCGIRIADLETHEPSSVFIYDVIDAFGGTENFYSSFYISSVSPLGFVSMNERGSEVNHNYYDSNEMMEAATPFIIESIRQQLSWGLLHDECIVFGTGKNDKFIRTLNEKEKFFSRIHTLEHPRYIMQYKLKQKHLYLDKYLRLMSSLTQR
jgi:hypothetical protein